MKQITKEEALKEFDKEFPQEEWIRLNERTGECIGSQVKSFISELFEKDNA